jgi:FMN-dependent oxidoreductase (nitrilotriacetate monooxygenase family)
LNDFEGTLHAPIGWTMARKDKMRMMAMWHPPGSHTAGWRMPDAPPRSETTFKYFVDVAQICERAKFDALFFADVAVVQSIALLEKGDSSAGYFSRAVSLEPMSLLPALAAVTSRIGLIATGSTTYSDPYTIARRFSAIDQISGGRGGWNVVTSQFVEEAGNYGHDEHMPHAERDIRANEFFDVVANLWDSWAPDAIIEDKQTAQVFDPKKVRVLNHQGKYFKVKGPLNEARSPQGRPIVCQAGSSGPGQDIAARISDVVFSAQSELEDGRKFYAGIRKLAEGHGRNPDHVKVLPGIMPIVGRTEEEAKARYLQLQGLITDDQAIRTLQRISGGIDLRKYPLDGPLPDLPLSNGAQARQQRMIETARKQNLTLRQVGRWFAESRSHHLVYGTPSQIVDVMQDWYEGLACDGFCILFPYYRSGVTDFAELVIPELQRRGLFRTEYEGTTLRENLGLPMPKSYFDS